MKTDEIGSTERLLNLIRGKEAPAPVEGAPPRTQQGPSEIKAALSFLTSRSKHQKDRISVGVDIGNDRLRLVKLNRSEGKWQILAHRSVDLPAGSERDSDAFVGFLREEIASFSDDAEHAEIWTTMSSASVEVRQIQIPRVPEAQREQAVYWTLKKDVSFDDNAFFFDYELLKEFDDAGVRKLQLMCYTAPRQEVESLKNLFIRTGYSLAGITILPFVVQNIFKTQWMTTRKYTACLFIGNEYSRIDLFVDGRMALTRDIRTGINSMIEMTAEAFRVRLGEGGPPDQVGDAVLTGSEALQAGMESIRDLPSADHRQDHERARNVLFTFGREEFDSFVIDDAHSIMRTELEEIITPVLERLVRQMERTFDHYSTNLGYERIEEVYVSSVMPLSKAMVGYFEKQLGITSNVFDPIGPAMSDENFVERVALIPAFGLAFSDTAYTPNFIFTYKDKNKKVAEERLNKIILASFVVILLVCSGVLANLLVTASSKKTALARLEQDLQKQSPKLTRETVASVVAQYKEQQGRSSKLGERYAGIAVLSELSSLLPDAASLVSFKYSSRERTGADAEKTDRSKRDSAGRVQIEGTISGDRGLADSALTSYVMKLNASPLFREVTVSRNIAKVPGQGAVLAFTLTAKIGPKK